MSRPVIKPHSTWAWLATRPAVPALVIGLVLGALITVGAYFKFRTPPEFPEVAGVVDIFTGRVIGLAIDGSICVKEDATSEQRCGGVFRMDVTLAMGDDLKIVVLRIQTGPQSWIDHFVVIGKA